MDRLARGGGIAFSLCIAATVITGAPGVRADETAATGCGADAAALVGWNAVTSDALSIDAALGPPVMGVGLAYVEAAVYNAVEGLTGSYELYKWNKPGPHGASVDAAIAAAARAVLVTQFPASEARVEAAYVDALAVIPDGHQKTAGITYGEQAAEHVLHQRADDGWMAAVTWDRSPAPGVWRPTPPGFAPYAAPWLSQMTPFMLKSADQFRPGPPPALTSDEYTADFLEVAEIGSATSATRTAEQTEIARFYSASLPVQLQAGFRDHVTRHCLGVSDAARYFAMASLNTADSQIAGGDTKFEYGTWRPVTAIQEADTDGNPDTQADPSWTPLLITPPHPDYLSGHNIAIGAVTASLRSMNGTARIDLELSSSVTGTTRQYVRARTLRQEGIGARIWGGIHTRFADETGTRVGAKIGRWTSSRYFGEVAG
jgi:hypothetical protein